MTETLLTRRLAGAYSIVAPPPAQEPPGVRYEEVAGTDSACLGLDGDVLFHRRHGVRWVEEGGSPFNPSDWTDPGYVRSLVASQPLSALPFSDPAAGADRVEVHRTSGGWDPYVEVKALAVDEATGTLVVWWYRADEWWTGTGDVLRISCFSLGSGAKVAEVQVPITDPLFAPAISGIARGGLVWSIEPEPAPASYGRFFIPLRVVERSVSTLAVTASISWGDDYVEPFAVAVHPTGLDVWVFLNRRWVYGTGPYPALTGFGDGYDTVNLLSTSAGLAGGSEQLLDFGLGDGTPSPGYPYYMYGIFDARGGAVCWDGEETDGTPIFLSLSAQNPGSWTTSTIAEAVFRFRPDGGGTHLEDHPVPYDPTRGSVWRIGAGDYLIQLDSPGQVAWILREAIP